MEKRHTHCIPGTRTLKHRISNIKLIMIVRCKPSCGCSQIPSELGSDILSIVEYARASVSVKRTWTIFPTFPFHQSIDIAVLATMAFLRACHGLEAASAPLMCTSWKRAYKNSLQRVLVPVDIHPFFASGIQNAVENHRAQ